MSAVVLMAVDDAAWRELLDAALRRDPRCAQVLHASTYAGLLNFAMSGPDAVIVDRLLAGAPVVSVLPQLRRLLREATLIVSTATDSDAIRDDVLRSGADHVVAQLTTPVSAIVELALRGRAPDGVDRGFPRRQFPMGLDCDFATDAARARQRAENARERLRADGVEPQV